MVNAQSNQTVNYYLVTFKGICCTGCVVFVWVELERKLPVGLLQIIVIDFFVDAQHFVVILTTLYSEGQRRKKKTNWWLQVTSKFEFHPDNSGTFTQDICSPHTDLPKT